MRRYVIINEQVVAQDEATISIYDLGLLRGYAIFDYFKIVNHRPIWFEDHLDRFYFSAAEMNMPVPLQRNELKDLVKTLMDKNNIADSGIRILLTGGYAEDGYSFEKPNLIITQDPFSYNKNIFEKGTRLLTYEHHRQVPHIKTTDYLQAVRLQKYVVENNADDLLYCWQGAVLEAPRSTIFIVNEQGEINTPATGVLQGITRKKILSMQDFNITQCVVSTEMLQTAAEVFITSTSKAVMPVINIDGRTIGDGKPGPITRKIWTALMELQEKS